MTTYATNQFRPGLKVILENSPCSILQSEFVKRGKGQSFYRVRFRNLVTGRVWDRTLRSGETMEAADVVELAMDYLYNDGQQWHFMRTDETYEQVAANQAVVGDTKWWLTEQGRCTVVLWNNEPISVVPPNFVELEVQSTEPGVKGDTAQGGNKPAILVTGAEIRVPLFVEIGDVIRVDTRTGAYVSRAK